MPALLFFCCKGSRKNNFPFSHPIFEPGSADLHSHNPQRRPCDACGCHPSDRPNLIQILARILGSYSFASPKVYEDAFSEAVVADEAGFKSEGFHEPAKDYRACDDDKLTAWFKSWHA